MRKVTGYIGALIVVVALMGSILAGYALNINGQSTVVNEYENVTDVSGLYSHTDQKTYIDYNPASNYIGYEKTGATYNNPAQSVWANAHFKKVTNGTINIKSSPKSIKIDGVEVGAPTADPYYAAISDYFYMYWESGSNLTIYANNRSARPAIDEATITITDNSLSLYYKASSQGLIPNEENTWTWNVSIKNCLISTGSDNWDYRVYRANISPWNIYLNSPDQIIGTTATPRGVFSGNTLRYVDDDGGRSVDYIIEGSNIDALVAQYQVIPDIPAYEIFYPKSVSAQYGWIDYTESNRVNNYPVIVNPANTSTAYNTINLQNISATDYWPNGNNGALGPGMALNYLKEIDGYNRIWEWYTQMPHLVSYSNDPNVAPVLDESGLHSYRLSDILNSYSMPANTRTLTIDFNSGTTKNISENTHNQYYNVNLDYNFAGVIEIGQNKSNNSFILVNDVKDQKDYIVYDVERRTATVYDYNGVAKRTDSPDNILIGFDKVSTAIYSVVGVYSTALMAGFAPFYVNTSDRPQPTMNITALSVDPGEIDYIDITKGYSIKSSNVTDVVWNNGYENGNIQLLFRSLDTSETYHNTLTISGNTIDVDYTASKFYVSLNGDDAVNIGTWRNIILDIDLENGTLNAIPVRTFNSFTNVQMDNAVIPIGELVSAAPTNTITWNPTPNSLLFNVYLTSVFMDTYGVVMADPTLNITDYFTNLDNFYRLKLSKFSVIGDSITINGQTYPVSDNTVTIDNKILQIKDVYITYADGHAYIEDSNSTIDLGEITSNIISMAGAWYFETYLEKGYTQLKQIYTWDWSDFILDNTQFCIFYIGLAVAGLIVAKRFCSMSVIDYAVFIISIVIALGVQVIA